MTPREAALAVGLFFLALALALALAGAGPGAPGARGGAEAGARRREGAPRLRKPAPSGAPHRLGRALQRFARRLPAVRPAVHHPLDAAGYSALRVGGAPAAKPRRPWTAYATWAELDADPGALAAYFAARTEAINNPAFEWGGVFAALAPLLHENREYIGVLNAGADGRTLEVTALEASPLETGSIEGRFAGVPEELVAKYGERPALFIFHTHPADTRGSPLPSSQDLTAAIYLGVLGRFAASVVVSRYGALVYGPDWGAYKAVNQARDWELALLNLCHDVAAAHEAVRSWDFWTLADYFAFYPRHRLFFSFAPSAELVGELRRFRFCQDLESSADLELLGELRADILDHSRRAGPAPPPGPPPLAASLSRHPALRLR